MTKKITSTITNNTTVSLSIVLTIAGGVFWLVTSQVQVRADTTRNTEDIRQMREDMRSLTNSLQDLNSNIIKLNTLMEKR